MMEQWNICIIYTYYLKISRNILEILASSLLIEFIDTDGRILDP
jgi:hypothetical protein